MSSDIIHPGLEEKLEAAYKSEAGLEPLLALFARSVADNWAIAEHYHKQILKVCDQYSNGKNLAEGIKELASVLYYYYVTQFDKVAPAAERATELFELNNSNDLLGVTLMIKGTANRSFGKFDKAVSYLTSAGNLINEKGLFSVYFSFAHYQLAEIFVHLKDYELAENHYVLSAEVAKLDGDPTAYFRTTNGLGNLYMATGELEKAQEYLDHSLELAKFATPRSRALCDLGILSIKKGDFQLAADQLEESYTIRHENGYEDASSTSLIHLGNAYLELNRLDEAEECGLKALVIIDKFKSTSKRLLTFDLLGRTKEAKKEWESAVSYLRKHQKLQHELNSQQMRNIYKTKNKLILSQKEVIEEAHKEITDSIAYAKRIQTAILPPDSMLEEYLQSHFVLYKPKDVVAGDFYWLEVVGEVVLFAAADCTGHGVPGAMVSVVCHNALNRSVREFGFTDPGKILDKTREIIIEEFEKSEEEVKDGMDIGLVSFNRTTRELQFSGAHNPLWIIRNGELIEHKGDKQPVGLFSYAQEFNTLSLKLEENDTFYLQTDGYIDQFGGEKGKKFKAKNLKNLLLTNQNLGMQEQKSLLDQTFMQWKDTLEQIDDVCLIGVKV